MIQIKNGTRLLMTGTIIHDEVNGLEMDVIREKVAKRVKKWLSRSCQICGEIEVDVVLKVKDEDNYLVAQTTCSHDFNIEVKQCGFQDIEP